MTVVFTECVTHIVPRLSVVLWLMFAGLHGYSPRALWMCHQLTGDPARLLFYVGGFACYWIEPVTQPRTAHAAHPRIQRGAQLAQVRMPIASRCHNDGWMSLWTLFFPDVLRTNRGAGTVCSPRCHGLRFKSLSAWPGS